MKLFCTGMSPRLRRLGNVHLYTPVTTMLRYLYFMQKRLLLKNRNSFPNKIL